jgi:hypothetical protein
MCYDLPEGLDGVVLVELSHELLPVGGLLESGVEGVEGVLVHDLVDLG